jgi:hypothetical protein
MPFASAKQAKFAFATHQKWAKEFASKTNYKDLPEQVKHKAIKDAAKRSK